jgi:hypothetical protein
MLIDIDDPNEDPEDSKARAIALPIPDAPAVIRTFRDNGSASSCVNGISRKTLRASDLK